LSRAIVVDAHASTRPTASELEIPGKLALMRRAGGRVEPLEGRAQELLLAAVVVDAATVDAVTPS
jgi:hypothetical protein